MEKGEKPSKFHYRKITENETIRINYEKQDAKKKGVNLLIRKK